MTEPASSSPATPNLGFDLLGIIFYELAQLAHRGYKCSPKHLESLLLVNREWHSCALAHSRIWSMFHITWQIDYPRGSVKRWRSRVNRFLQRSKASTLTIRIRFSGFIYAHADDPTCRCSFGGLRLLGGGGLNSLIDIACKNPQRYFGHAREAMALLVGAGGEHMKRWGDLEIHWDDWGVWEDLYQMYLPHFHADLLQDMRYPTPALKRLSLNLVHRAFGAALPEFPALQTLIMYHCPMNPLEGRSTSLKYLELAGSLHELTLPSRSTLSTLEHLNIRVPPERQGNDLLQKWLACTLPNLRVLELQSRPPSCLHKLVVPNLHSVILHAPGCFPLNLPFDTTVNSADLQAILPFIETLSVYWKSYKASEDVTDRREEFIEECLQKVLEMAIGLVEIRLGEELYYGTRAMLRDRPHLVPELQRVMVFREGVPVEVDGRNIAEKLGMEEWRAILQLLPEGCDAYAGRR
jgi:hypothetical protein